MLLIVTFIGILEDQGRDPDRVFALASVRGVFVVADTERILPALEALGERQGAEAVLGE